MSQVEISHEASDPCLDSAISLFDVPKTQISYDGVSEIEIFPTSTVMQGNDITFMINSLNAQSYLDLTSAYFAFKLKITRDDGSVASTPGEDGGAAILDQVTVANAFSSTFLKHIVVQANDTIISTYDSFYMRNLVDCMLHSNESMQDQLESTQFYYRTEDAQNDSTAPAWAKRFERTKGSKEFTIIVPFNTEIASCAKLLLPGVNLKIVLSLTLPDFHLVKAAGEGHNHHVVINESKLMIKKWVVSPSVCISHENILRQKNATLTFRNLRTIERVVPAGITHISFDNIFTRIVPYNIYCFLQPSADFSGRSTSDPTVFTRHGLIKMVLNVEDERFEYLFGEDNILSYYKMLESLGERRLKLPLNQYENNTFFVLFPLTTGTQAGELRQIKRGNIRLTLFFERETAAALTLSVVTESPSIVQITKDRKILQE
jgi:hypothetical protein